MKTFYYSDYMPGDDAPVFEGTVEAETLDAALNCIEGSQLWDHKDEYILVLDCNDEEYNPLAVVHKGGRIVETSDIELFLSCRDELNFVKEQ